MELTQLKYFFITAGFEHITRAAEELHVAQPALTQSIHRLEEELGVKLFDRHGRNIKLSPPGKILQKRLSVIFSELDDAISEMCDVAGIADKTIRLNVMAATKVITDIIIAYKKKVSDVNFQLTQEPGHRDCDFTVSSFSQEEGRTVFGEQVPFTERIFLAVPIKSHYAAMRQIELKALKNEKFISLAGSKAFRNICDEYCRKAGFEPKVIFESDSPDAVRNLIGAGLGVGFWPQYTWGPVFSENVVLLPVSRPDCKRSIVVSRESKTAENGLLDDFYSFMLEYFHRLANPFPLNGS